MSEKEDILKQSIEILAHIVGELSAKKPAPLQTKVRLDCGIERILTQCEQHTRFQYSTISATIPICPSIRERSFGT